MPHIFAFVNVADHNNQVSECRWSQQLSTGDLTTISQKFARHMTRLRDKIRDILHDFRLRRDRLICRVVVAVGGGV
jgi:hypothetical protein